MSQPAQEANTMQSEALAKKAADAVGVTPYSDMRPFVEQAVKWALNEAALSTDAEPVLLQHRIAARGGKDAPFGEWSDWRDGPVVVRDNDYIKWEERSLYAAPPAPAVAVKDAIAEAEALADRAGIDIGDDRDMFVDDLAKTLTRFAALYAQVQDVATAREFADRMFKLSGFMLSEEYRGKPAVTITFPDNAERNQFYSAIVDLSTHKTPAAPAAKQGEAE